MYRFKTSYLVFVPSFIISLQKCLTLNTYTSVASAHRLFCIFLLLICTCDIPSASSKINEPENGNTGKILVETNNQLLFSDEQDIEENTVVNKNNDNNNGEESNSLLFGGSSRNQPLFHWYLKGEDNVHKKDGQTEKETPSSSLLSFFSKTPKGNLKQQQGQVNSRSWTQWFVNNFLPKTNSYRKRTNQGLGKHSKYRLPKLPKSTTQPTTTEFIPDDDEMNTATENPKKRTTPKPGSNTEKNSKFLDPRDKTRVNLTVKRGPGARYTNGSLCPTEYEERFCWSDGGCPWYDTCKTVNCVISCVRRKGVEWLSVKHDSVGIHLRDVKLVEEKSQTLHPTTPGKSKKPVTVKGKGGTNPKQAAKEKDKKKQKEKGKVPKNPDKPTTSSQKKIKKA